MLVLLAPGQGSQLPGMLTPWLALPGAGDALARWSGQTGLDLRRLGTEAPAEELRDTAVAQPLLTAAALLSARALDVRPDAVCGHSIGELPALALAGVLDDDTAVLLAARRGAAMARAAAERPTGMAAVLGGDPTEVEAATHRHGLALATVNVAGQVVLGGSAEALDALAADPPAGARVRRLEVAGAFHTTAMASAADALAEALSGVRPGEPTCRVVANADGATVGSGAELLGRLVAQLTGPVRFDRCLQALSEATAVVELAPGGTLTAMAKRALPGARLAALKTPDDLVGAQELAGVSA